MGKKSCLIMYVVHLFVIIHPDFLCMCVVRMFIVFIYFRVLLQHFQQLNCASSPKCRMSHSSTVVTINGSAHLIVSGGVDKCLNHSSVINDFWILDIESRQWKEV